MKKKIPIGIQDYQELRLGNYNTVDKTLMIQDFLEKGSKVTLITRPRRFGKTLNMSMIAEFFDITKDSKMLFEGLAIMKTEYVKEMNQHPVIFISFANAKGDMKGIVKYIKLELQKEYERFHYIFEKLTAFQTSSYDKIVESLMNYNDGKLEDIDNAITFIMEVLEAYYNKKVYIFIDEYDTPFIQAHINGFYGEIHNELSNLFSTTLKGNASLALAMLTGIQRIAKENIFSGLNNLKICTVEDELYSQYFGFTHEETQAFLNDYGIALTNEVKQMYNGYHFGKHEIYNPWSIINYVDSGLLKAYWVNTSSNSMIKNAMKKVDSSFLKGYEGLIETGNITTNMDMATSFYEHATAESLWGLFVNAGYLTITEIIDIEEQLYTLRVPNREVLKEFKELTAFYLNTGTNKLNNLYHSLLKKNQALFLETYESILLANPSYHDLENENSYHLLLLGICLYIKNDFEVISNREVGTGRCDLILKAKKTMLPSYVIEIKHVKNVERLDALATKAMKQIKEHHYDYELSGEIIHIGLAHYGKKVRMIWQQAS